MKKTKLVLITISIAFEMLLFVPTTHRESRQETKVIEPSIIPTFIPTVTLSEVIIEDTHREECELRIFSIEDTMPKLDLLVKSSIDIAINNINKNEIHIKQNRWDISLNDNEIELLAKIVWLESRGEEDLGQQAVVEVVFNRMIFPYEFSGTVEDVLSMKGQFTTWKNKGIAEPSEKEYSNIQKVLDGETNILKSDTVYFATFPHNSNIDKHIGNHYFCKYEY